jgi:hypothetical protein
MPEEVTSVASDHSGVPTFSSGTLWWAFATSAVVETVLPAEFLNHCVFDSRSMFKIAGYKI